LQIAKEVERQDTIFVCKMLQAKLLGLNNKEEGIKELADMLKEYSENEQVAALHYEIWKLNGREEHRIQALDLYQKLFAKTPMIEYMKRTEELS